MSLIQQLCNKKRVKFTHENQADICYDNIKFEEESEPVEVLPDGIMEEYTEQKPDYY